MAKTNEGGVWDQDALGRVVKQTQQVAKAKAVRDDWDDDDDDDDDKEEQEKATASEDKAAPVLGPTRRREQEEGENSNIWEEANKRAPMPELIVAPASTSQSFLPPPPAALQPTLRILKRPSPNTSARANHATSSASLSLPCPGPTSPSGGTSPGPRGTLAEREAQYQEARSRIFGENSRERSIVVRDPLGPPEPEPEMGDPNQLARGFGERRRGKK